VEAWSSQFPTQVGSRNRLVDISRVDYVRLYFCNDHDLL